uniref:Reverse transcriptase domain-containing protein n=1 Tax=Tanacetum cinerariifolium TaxID=118510 RepID=A0A6L2MRD9_TANCI|nr:hypothetical protein [Tanacetum cinerariifolium]
MIWEMYLKDYKLSMRLCARFCQVAEHQHVVGCYIGFCPLCGYEVSPTLCGYDIVRIRYQESGIGDSIPLASLGERPGEAWCCSGFIERGVKNSQSNFGAAVEEHRNRKHSKQLFILEESTIVTMAVQRTMAELLRAPTEGYAEAIVVPPILAEQFKLKHSLINMMTTDQRTQDVLTIIENKSKVRNSRNKSVVSQVKSCDANSNSLEIAKLTHAVNHQTSAVTTAMTAILKQFQATPPPASVKAVEKICVTCGGAHPYYQCLAAGGNTFL